MEHKVDDVLVFQSGLLESIISRHSREIKEAIAAGPSFH